MGAVDDIRKAAAAAAAAEKAKATAQAPTAAETVQEAAPVPSSPEAAAPAPPAPKPAAKPAPKPAAKKRTYTVKSGDTLSAIGARFDVSWQKIAEVNKIKNPDLIYPGQTFVIPD